VPLWSIFNQKIIDYNHIFSLLLTLAGFRQIALDSRIPWIPCFLPWGRRKLIVSAQGDESIWRCKHYKYRYLARFGLSFRVILFSKFSFLKNDRRYQKFFLPYLLVAFSWCNLIPYFRQTDINCPPTLLAPVYKKCAIYYLYLFLVFKLTLLRSELMSYTFSFHLRLHWKLSLCWAKQIDNYLRTIRTR